MLMVAWREIISGDNGFSVEKSTVCGSGCSLPCVSLSLGEEREVGVLRELWPLHGRQNLPRLLQGGLGLHLLHLFGFGDALVVAVVVLGV